MSYNYEAMRPGIFTEKGTQQLLVVRDKARGCLRVAGAVKMDHFTTCEWEQMAMADYLVEREELREVTTRPCHGQDRVFVAGKNNA
jgi:hypothetical protein